MSAGATGEFIEFLKLCVLTGREIKDAEEFLNVEAENDFDLAGLSDCSYYSERLSKLVEIACEYYNLSGFRYDYNDGCYDRYSGYSMSSDLFSVLLAEVARASAREKMLGRLRLRERLVRINVSAKRIEGLTAF